MKSNSPNKIICHHAVSLKTHTAKDVSSWHRERWGGYRPSRRGGDTRFAGYHYVIEWDGTIVQCRDHDEEGIHCIGQNFSSLGVCFMGNFDKHLPSDEQKWAWLKLYSEKLDGLPVYPHRKYATKSCHGSLLDDDYFARLVHMQRKRDLIERLTQLISKLQSLLTARRMR